ncbi:MAG: PhoD-like phosphatase N-terminal domain-containing protein, partial [Lentisphaeraceae bacterium]|nr:PhoD-like phosphatase N-terminal domain-containing protein [Lentisphaeraceae bacterium]
MKFEKLDELAKHQGGLNRRLFMSFIASLSALPIIGLSSCAGARKLSSLKENPFTLGVASGDPDHEGMVLWTKLAPKPLQLDSGMPIDAFVEVTWEVASDDEMKNIIQSGIALATPHLGHSVHVETKGLDPDSWYWYRFRVGQYESAIGRTRTMPLDNVLASKLRFAVTSCQNFEHGLFTAYEQMIQDDVDLVFHLGDYIYEYKGFDNKTRKHIGPEIENVAQYRQRYAQYK